MAARASGRVCRPGVKIPALFGLGRLVSGGCARLMGRRAGGAMIGTVLGNRIRRQVSPETVVGLYRIAMIVAGGKVLVFDGLAPLLGAP